MSSDILESVFTSSSSPVATTIEVGIIVSIPLWDWQHPQDCYPDHMYLLQKPVIPWSRLQISKEKFEVRAVHPTAFIRLAFSHAQAPQRGPQVASQNDNYFQNIWCYFYCSYFPLLPLGDYWGCLLLFSHEENCFSIPPLAQYRYLFGYFSVITIIP